jgi:hypothetical protein
MIMSLLLLRIVSTRSLARLSSVVLFDPLFEFPGIATILQSCVLTASDAWSAKACKRWA